MTVHLRKICILSPNLARNVYRTTARLIWAIYNQCPATKCLWFSFV